MEIDTRTCGRSTTLSINTRATVDVLKIRPYGKQHICITTTRTFKHSPDTEMSHSVCIRNSELPQLIDALLQTQTKEPE